MVSPKRWPFLRISPSSWCPLGVNRFLRFFHETHRTFEVLRFPFVYARVLRKTYIDGPGGQEGQWKFHRIVKWLGLRNRPRIATTRSVYDRLTNYVYTDTPSSRFWHKNVVDRVCVTIRVNGNGDSVLLEQIKKGPRWWLVYLPHAQIVIAGVRNSRPCELRTFSKARYR